MAKAAKRQSTEYREREAQAMASKRQSDDYRERSTKKETMPYQKEICSQQDLAGFSSLHCSY